MHAGEHVGFSQDSRHRCTARLCLTRQLVTERPFLEVSTYWSGSTGRTSRNFVIVPTMYRREQQNNLCKYKHTVQILAIAFPTAIPFFQLWLNSCFFFLLLRRLLRLLLRLPCKVITWSGTTMATSKSPLLTHDTRAHTQTHARVYSRIDTQWQSTQLLATLSCGPIN